jgi:two-component system nitrogen regulation sensor histidine kinase NtrY
MAGLFTLISTIPAILLAIAASMTLDLGLDRWFGDRTKTIIENSQSVAQSYLNEHGAVIRTDIIAIARDIERLEERILDNSEVSKNFLNQQSFLRKLPGIYLLKEDGTLVDGSDIAEDFAYEPPPTAGIDGAKEGDLVFLSPGRRNLVGAILKLKVKRDLYLYVTRPVNPEVMTYLRQTEAEVQEYRALEDRRAGIQVAFAMLYVMIATVVMSTAIWAGIGVSNWLVSPMRRLIYAADQVSQGNFYVEVPVQKKLGDFATLGRSFNTMTERLQRQRADLLLTNQKLDQRSQFMQAVLSGISAGVLGLDDQGIIRLANRPAVEILQPNSRTSLIGRSIQEVFPASWSLFQRAQKTQNARNVTAQIEYQAASGMRNLNVRVTSEAGDDNKHGYVVTIDDITDLVSAQRSSAWADVARRIAHEIKNPLTPIQLSAERLRRKFGKNISPEEQGVFFQCTDTIVRQVEDIGRMVDEFSSFARMPKPHFAPHDINEIVRQAVFLMRVGRDDISFEMQLSKQPLVVPCDHRLLSQAMTNVLKNAMEAIAEHKEKTNQGRIVVSVVSDADKLIITIDDNGKGLPLEQRNRLLEPYMTTRDKGTGLGLAIVSKIMEDHGGGIELGDNPDAKANGGTGARISLIMASNLPNLSANSKS